MMPVGVFVCAGTFIVSAVLQFSALVFAYLRLFRLANWTTVGGLFVYFAGSIAGIGDIHGTGPIHPQPGGGVEARIAAGAVASAGTGGGA